MWKLFKNQSVSSSYLVIGMYRLSKQDVAGEWDFPFVSWKLDQIYKSMFLEEIWSYFQSLVMMFTGMPPPIVWCVCVCVKEEVMLMLMVASWFWMWSACSSTSDCSSDVHLISMVCLASCTRHLLCSEVGVCWRFMMASSWQLLPPVHVHNYVTFHFLHSPFLPLLSTCSQLYRANEYVSFWWCNTHCFSIGLHVRSFIPDMLLVHVCWLWM